MNIPIDECNSTYGELTISPAGDVLIGAEFDYSNAACFTSLDGVSFVVTIPVSRRLR